ncbi:MAG: hypothetical protein FWG14_09025 [Peptococcaceae bacterium]|nr:hypothetical protein [Peptococcaceae bacterium]
MEKLTLPSSHHSIDTEEMQYIDGGGFFNDLIKVVTVPLIAPFTVGSTLEMQLGIDGPYTDIVREMAGVPNYPADSPSTKISRETMSVNPYVAPVPTTNTSMPSRK